MLQEDFDVELETLSRVDFVFADGKCLLIQPDSLIVNGNLLTNSAGALFFLNFGDTPQSTLFNADIRWGYLDHEGNTLRSGETLNKSIDETSDDINLHASINPNFELLIAGVFVEFDEPIGPVGVTSGLRDRDAALRLFLSGNLTVVSKPIPEPSAIVLGLSVLVIGAISLHRKLRRA